MEKRWRVYHGNDDLGLKTAKEIREALRQGSLDPFDKVSRENSNIREELIEVDEIFRETVDSPPVSARFDNRDPDGTVVVEPKLKAPAPFNAPNFNSARSNARAPLPVYEEEERNDNTGRGNSTKRYYLIDKEKVLGPLSALEIQSLFNRKMLNIKVRVQKIGNEKTIPITQFIASYSGDRLKELTEDGHIPQQIGLGSPSSKVMNELARMANSRRVAKGRRDRAYLMMTIAGLILGAGVYLIYEQSTHRREDRVSEAQEEVPRDPQPPKGNKGQRPRLVQKSPEVLPVPELATTPKKRVVRDEPIKEAIPAAVNLDAMRPRSPGLNESRLRENRNVSPDRPVIKKRGPEPAVVNRVAVQNPDIKATDNIPQATGPIGKAIELAGRIQKIGPLNFNMQALEACSSKCTLTLKDTTGATLRAVFFKSAYYDLLKTRSKAVFLTGNTKLDRGELTLFIQVVH